MGEIIARFADGRLLVQEEKAIETHYRSGGAPFRIGGVKVVEKVLSIDAHLSGYPEYSFIASLKEVKISGDTIIPILRVGLLSGVGALSGVGYPGLPGVLSNVIFSGQGPTSQLTSGLSSGVINIIANVIGF